ncbi:MAG TPA: hypothetical protein VIM55_05285 [Mucilaginibacter sp.]
MEKIEISVTDHNVNYRFEVRDYMHHSGDHCKFELFDDNRFIASFEPDGHHGLYICKNSGIVNEEVLHLVAEKLESLNLQP